MKIIKILFDYSTALFCLFILMVPFLVLYILSSIDTKQNGLFAQKRVGRGGKVFKLYKIRTMKGQYSSAITTRKMKITKVGRVFRKYKLDEIPQIFNILKGNMSWVGPRPDVEGYADKLTGEDRIILSVKPGITGPAQLKYRNEEEILSNVKDPEKYNDEVIWKDKVEINKKYIKNWTFRNDIFYLIRTFL